MRRFKLAALEYLPMPQLRSHLDRLLEAVRPHPLHEQDREELLVTCKRLLRHKSSVESSSDEGSQMRSLLNASDLLCDVALFQSIAAKVYTDVEVTTVISSQASKLTWPQLQPW